MFCYKCGSQCESEQTNCTMCGAKVLHEQEGVVYFIPSQLATEQLPPPISTSNSSLMSRIPEHFRNDNLAVSAVAGSASAQYQLARRYLTGLDSFDHDMHQCFFWLDLAAHGGHPEAMSMLGSLKLIGQDTKVDKPGGMKWLLKAAAQGEVGAMACLYSIYKNGLPDYLPPDNSKAFGYLVKLVEAGHLESYNILGFHYFEGVMVSKDEARAFELWKYAADHGHAEAQKNVSKCYEDGCGTRKDEKAAREFLVLAADHGDQEAIICLANRLIHGKNGYPQNIPQAMHYLEKIYSESSDAYCLYALCLIKSPDDRGREEGLRMLETRAAEGDGEANFTLSNLYSSGGEDGMRENFMKTLNYLMAAANAGHPLAIEMLDRMNMKEVGSTQYKYVEPPKKQSLFSKIIKKHMS